jgi:hypothetical protein
MPQNSPASADALARRDLGAELLALVAADAPAGPVAWTQFFQRQRRVREALIQRLSPGGAFMRAFAETLQSQLPGLTAANALPATDQVMHNRAKQQTRWLALLNDDGFRASVMAQAAAPPPEPPPIDAEKREELVAMLLQPHAPGGPEPAVHILANADGQKRWHEALAVCWEPGGALHEQLLREMKAALPDVPASDVALAADRFIGQRYIKAVSVAAAMEPDSGVVQDAMRRSLGELAQAPAAPKSTLRQAISVLLGAATPSLSA